MTTIRMIRFPAWFPCVLACFVLAGGAASGQAPFENDEPTRIIEFPERRPIGDFRATTPFEGHARGLSEIIRARAAYNLTVPEVLQGLSEAAREQIRAREEWTHTYFQLREANREYRAKEQLPRPTAEDIVRYAQMGRPERLSPGEVDPVEGTLAWPGVLQDPAFAEGRAELERLFADWIHYGTLSLENRRQIRSTTDVMLRQLQDHIDELPPPDYMTARRFLESLAYEAYLAAS